MEEGKSRKSGVGEKVASIWPSWGQVVVKGGMVGLDFFA